MLLIDQILTNEGERIVNEIKQAILEKKVTPFGPVNASGGLYNSIRFDVFNGVLKVYANDYIYYLEYGRKPGRKPPIKPLQEWMNNKGILGNVFALQNAIAKKGTIIFQQGGALNGGLLRDVVNSELVDKIKDRLFVEISESVVGQVKSQVLKSIR